MTPQVSEITQLLVEWGEGNQEAREKLMALVYDELKRIARHYLRKEFSKDGLQTTALVHEAYLRLVNVNTIQARDRAQFFGLAANLIRQILVDHSRARLAQRRGSGLAAIPLDGIHITTSWSVIDVVLLDDAMCRLERLSIRQKDIVEMRVFGGLSHLEIADLLGVSTRTVDRDWTMARAWLQRELTLNSKS